jgi:replicative DNA helicase
MKNQNTSAKTSRSSTFSKLAMEQNLLGKIPPQATELEEAVLGALMLEKEALNDVIEILKPESFYKDEHRNIYEAIISLFKKSEPVDLLTVVSELRRLGSLEAAGGSSYIAQLTTRVNSSANVVFHARVVAEQAIKRELISVASEILKDGYEDVTDVFQLLDRTQQALFEISESNIRKNYENMQSVMSQAFMELEIRKNHKDGLTGVPTGFMALDRITSGWQKSDLIILAARPAMGKTAFVLSALRNAAVMFKKPVAIFSLEMSSIQLVNRLISAEAELESEKLKTGKLADYEWEQIVHRTAQLTEAPIFIDDTPAISILELRAKARRLKAQHDIQLVIIDYMQLMTGDTSKAGGNREQEIASISRALKQLAKELSIPVIALSQLSRAVETRGGDKKPQLSDLRESGSIEQDADMVLFLYRPEYYQITQDENGNSTLGTGEVIIAKHRNGALDTVRLKFIGKFTKFTNLDDEGGNFNTNYGSSFAQSSGIPSDFDSSQDNNSITIQSKLNNNGLDNKGVSGYNNTNDDEVPF